MVLVMFSKMNNDRRKFIKKAGVITLGLGMASPLLQAMAWRKNGYISANDKLSMIVIGCGGMGRALISRFITFNDVRVIALCDVDDNQLREAKKMVDSAYGNNDCRVYKDFRQILEKEKTDTAALALPDHWHAIISCAAANKKIHIYGEKPLARYLNESRIIVDTVAKNNIIWQTGSQQRSEAYFRHAAELVKNGRIGKVDYVEVGLPDGGHYTGNPPEIPVPEGVNWDMWLGPAPKVPFRGVLHGNWRWILDYSGGQLTDWAGHHIDIAHWGLGLDYTGPVAIQGTGRANDDGIYNVLVEYDFECLYANGLKMRVANQSKLQHGMGILWQGSDGWIHVNRSGLFASDQAILDETIGSHEIKLYYSDDHQRNFIDCVRSGKETIAPAEVGHRSISVALLGEIAIYTGAKLHWDPEQEMFTDHNTQATALLGKSYRKPWVLP
jgi:predicted dehydrogenase